MDFIKIKTKPTSLNRKLEEIKLKIIIKQRNDYGSEAIMVSI